MNSELRGVIAFDAKPGHIWIAKVGESEAVCEVVGVDVNYEQSVRALAKKHFGGGLLKRRMIPAASRSVAATYGLPRDVALVAKLSCGVGCYEVY